MELKNVRVEDIPENNRSFHEVSTLTEGELLRHGWLIISPSKTFAVYAQTAMEKQEWMSHMSRCIDEERKKAGMIVIFFNSKTSVLKCYIRFKLILNTNIYVVLLKVLKIFKYIIVPNFG